MPHTAFPATTQLQGSLPEGKAVYGTPRRRGRSRLPMRWLNGALSTSATQNQPTGPTPTPNSESAPLRRGVPYTAFPSGRLPCSCVVAGKAVWGNPRRALQRPYLGQRRRPPRSFFGGAVTLPIQYLMPLRETHRAGVPKALQKAGVGDRVLGQGPRRFSAAANRGSEQRQRAGAAPAISLTFL